MKIKQLIANFLKEEDGLTTVEYAIAGGVTAGAVLTAFEDLNAKIVARLEELEKAIKTTP